MALDLSDLKEIEKGIYAEFEEISGGISNDDHGGPTPNADSL